MAEIFDIEQRIAEIEAELTNLDQHRNQLVDELARLRRQSFQKDSSAQPHLPLQNTSVNNQSLQEEKIR
jgi:chorismate mutase